MNATVDSPETAPMYNVQQAARILPTISTTNQCSQILNHIIMKGSISQLEAESLYRVKRLTSRIHELKKMGVNILAEMRKDLTGVRYARYSIGS